MTTAEQEITAIISQLITDKLSYMRSFMKISNKDQVIVPLEPMAIQQGILDAISPVGSRSVVVKPRQVGATSIIIGFLTAQTLTVPGTVSVVVAYEEFITQRLLAKAQFYYDNIPEYGTFSGKKVRLKVEQGAASRNEKSFPGIHSTLYIGTAGARTFGRGDTIHNFLADEYAFWQNASHIMVPMLQAVPMSGRIIVTSTPNGEDNHFHDLYVEARDDVNSAWKAFFYPWYLHEEYLLNSSQGLISDRMPTLQNLTDDEMFLLDIGLSHDQLRWRRYKDDELRKLSRTQQDSRTFGQEYPEDDISCWLTAGNMVYDADLLSDMAQQSTVPTSYWKGSWEISYTDDDKVAIWEKPIEGVSYVMGVDPGMGRQTLTAITVWKFWTESDVVPGVGDNPPTTREHDRGEMVARCFGLIEPEDTAVIVKQLGNYYNHAYIIPESNNHGLAVLTHLSDYGNVYLRESIETGRIMRTRGWQTTPKSKPVMINATREMLGYLKIPDIRVISQFANIRRLLNPNTNPPRWEYRAVGKDDIHDSVALAMVGRPVTIAVKGLIGQAGYPDGWGEENYVDED